jgi:hypothetical protein
MKHSGMTRVKTVEPVRDFVLRLSFSDGTAAEIDLEPFLWGEVFEPLVKDTDLFRQVTVDEVLGTIVWPGEADLDPDVLYALATGTYEDLMRGDAASG